MVLHMLGLNLIAGPHSFISLIDEISVFLLFSFFFKPGNYAALPIFMIIVNTNSNSGFTCISYS